MSTGTGKFDPSVGIAAAPGMLPDGTLNIVVPLIGKANDRGPMKVLMNDRSVKYFDRNTLQEVEAPDK